MIAMISLVLTYFDPRRGPTVYQCIPENSLNSELRKKIESFMDLDFGKNSFEISLSDTNFKTFNHMINVPSPESRGYVESFLLSIIVDRNNDSQRMFKFLKEVNHEFLNCMEKIDDISNSHREVKEILEGYRDNLMEIVRDYKKENEIRVENEQEKNAFDFLFSNLQNLS